MPTRMSMPRRFTGSRAALAHSSARAGDSKRTKKPSPANDFVEDHTDPSMCLNVLHWSERAFGLQRGHGPYAQTEPVAQHLLGVLSQHGRGLHARRLAIDTHRPARHLERPMHGMNHGLHDPALLE